MSLDILCPFDDIVLQPKRKPTAAKAPMLPRSLCLRVAAISGGLFLALGAATQSDSLFSAGLVAGRAIERRSKANEEAIKKQQRLRPRGTVPMPHYRAA